MASLFPIFFAPLQGFTESAYRRAHAAVCGGVERYYAPFMRLEHGEIRRKDMRDADPSEARLVPQVIARDAAEFSVLSQALIAKGFREIDLNMGCPFPMQTKKGRGAGLLVRPDAVREIGDAMCRLHDEQAVRFSVKMRLGMTSATEWEAVMPILHSLPIEHITMHPRVAQQQYRGETDMANFRRFYDDCRLPIVYNGDIRSVEDLASLEREYPRLKAVMAGRGLLARPTLAMEWQTKTVASDDVVRDKIRSIHGLVLADYRTHLEGGDAQILQKMLPFWEYLEPLFGHKFIKQLTKSRCLADYLSLIDSQKGR